MEPFNGLPSLSRFGHFIFNHDDREFGAEDKSEDVHEPSSASSVALPSPASNAQESEEFASALDSGEGTASHRGEVYNKDQEDNNLYAYPSEDWFKHAPAAIDFAMQMMFVSGETAEPSVETTTLIEEITRQQVLEMVCAPSHRIWPCLLTDPAAHPQYGPRCSPWIPFYHH